MRVLISISALLICCICSAQYRISGTVNDKRGNPVFAANVYIKSDPGRGVATDFDGQYNLQFTSLTDTLIVSHISYKQRYFVVEDIDLSSNFTIVLYDKTRTIKEIIVTAGDPVSEQFSAVKLKQMQIYLNPVAQGDPLKAITVLPASTTVNETANPSLRGSVADRSRVVLNGVPVYNPVRANQLNNQGFFSLFNTSIIDKQYVYASNPPLTQGNTSAGLVEIYTLQQLERNQLSISTSLASTGLFLSHKIKGAKSFIQLYGNYQFSDAFVTIQRDKLPTIKSFYTKDIGVNLHSKTGKKTEMNSYNYYIDEAFNGNYNVYNYSGDIATNKQRFFSVNNLKYYTTKGILSINNGINISDQTFGFGSINSDQKVKQIYGSINYKWLLSESLNIQIGVTCDHQEHRFNDNISMLYSDVNTNLLVHRADTAINNTILEGYIYNKWSVTDRLWLSAGLRTNIPVNNIKSYYSAQLALRYDLSKGKSLLLSGGKYNSFSVPNYYNKSYNLLSAYQLALDFTMDYKNITVKPALYYKIEDGDNVIDNIYNADKTETFGVELYAEYSFLTYLKLMFANSYINQSIRVGNKEYKGASNFNYLLKTTLQYNNPKLFSVSVTYVARPGTYYTPVNGAGYNNLYNIYQPNYDINKYSSQYNSYNRVDISLNRYIKLKRYAIVAFATVNNIFNTKNQSSAYYNKDYTAKMFNHYQYRTVYVGVVWQLNIN